MLTRDFVSAAWAALMVVASGFFGSEGLLLLKGRSPFSVLIILFAVVSFCLLLLAILVARGHVRKPWLIVLLWVIGWPANVFWKNTMSSPERLDRTEMAVEGAKTRCRSGDCVPGDGRAVESPASTGLSVGSARWSDGKACYVMASLTIGSRADADFLAGYDDYFDARFSASTHGVRWLFDRVYPDVLVISADRSACPG